MGLLAKLKERVEQLQRAAMPDPAQFGDPIALSTQWTPLKPGGANFRTHTLALVDNRLTLNKSVGLTLFGLAFLIVGLVCSGIGIAAQVWFMALFGLPFAAIGAYVLKPSPMVFDGGTRQYTARGQSTPFGSIHAIQLIRERISGSESADFWSYELNLVLKDGTRVHVIDHSDLGTIRSNAQQISQHVGCRVWDGTQPP